MRHTTVKMRANQGNEPRLQRRGERSMMARRKLRVELGRKSRALARRRTDRAMGEPEVARGGRVQATLTQGRDQPLLELWRCIRRGEIEAREALGVSLVEGLHPRSRFFTKARACR